MEQMPLIPPTPQTKLVNKETNKVETKDPHKTKQDQLQDFKRSDHQEMDQETAQPIVLVDKSQSKEIV